MRAKRRLVTEESGLALPVAIMTVALLGVLGAGLLVFATTDLGIAAEENQSQRAFEMADAGVQAAKRQLDRNATFTAYDGGSDDVQWSSSKPNTDPRCSGLGGFGVCLGGLDPANPDSVVSVAITSQSQSGGGFKVVSTGRYGPAKRKIEAVFRQEGGVGIPPTYFSRSNISLGGNVSLSDISLFSRGNVTKSGGSGSFTGNDEYFKKWAATTDSFTYPNPFNTTARNSNRRAVGALGSVDNWYSNQGAQVFTGTTSGTNANPRMVETPSSPQPTNQITFPFDTRLSTLQSDIDALRQRAQELEAETGYDYYRPLPSPSTSATSAYRDISSWPSGSDYETVVFYEFASYSSTNVVKYSTGGCPNPTNRGVIVVVNGNFEMAGSTGFNGGVVTYTNPPSPSSGTFSSSGGSCLVGYANSTGTMSIQGTPGAGSVPALNTLSSFDGTMNVASWRELYE